MSKQIKNKLKTINTKPNKVKYYFLKTQEWMLGDLKRSGEEEEAGGGGRVRSQSIFRLARVGIGEG